VKQLLGTVLVVVPTLNEERTIRAVLTSLGQDLPCDRHVRFVVADGGSEDGTQEVVRSLTATGLDLRLLHNAKRWQSAGVNLAVRSHGWDADLLIRCDAHAIYPRGFIRELVQSLAVNDADAVVVPMDALGDTCLCRAIAWVSDSIVGSGGSAHRGGRRSGFVDHGHHAAFRMASFRRAGGYDETFRHNEDAELDCRQRALGSRIYLDALIRVGYYPRQTLRALARQYFNYGRGRSRTIRRHPDSARLRQVVVPIHVALSLALIVLAAWQPVLLLWPLTYLTVLTAVALSMAVEHRTPCGLLAAPAALVMHVSWAFGFIFGMCSTRETRWQRASCGDPSSQVASGGRS
jgi:succinoglycan biosynthesis protein ExoA